GCDASFFRARKWNGQGWSIGPEEHVRERTNHADRYSAKLLASLRRLLYDATPVALSCSSSAFAGSRSLILRFFIHHLFNGVPPCSRRSLLSSTRFSAR